MGTLLGFHVFLDASEHAIALTKDQADSKTSTFFYQLCTKILQKKISLR